MIFIYIDFNHPKFPAATSLANSYKLQELVFMDLKNISSLYSISASLQISSIAGFINLKLCLGSSGNK